MKDEFVMEMMQLVYLLGKEVIAILSLQCPQGLIKAEKKCNIDKQIWYDVLHTSGRTELTTLQRCLTKVELGLKSH